MSYKLADGSDSSDYNVGDLFVVQENNGTFRATSLIRYLYNDCSNCPKFELVKGHCKYSAQSFEYWHNLKPYGKEEKDVSALNTQVEGNHYKTMKLQPIELAYSLEATPCFTKLAKYLTRDKGDRLVNLEKAKHVVELERELLDEGFNIPYPNKWNSRKGKDILQVVGKIEEFTVDPYYREALVNMFYRNYEDALDIVEFIIQEESK